MPKPLRAPVSMRLPPDLLERIDALVRRQRATDSRITRTEVVETLLNRSLTSAERLETPGFASSPSY